MEHLVIVLYDDDRERIRGQYHVTKPVLGETWKTAEDENWLIASQTILGG